MAKAAWIRWRLRHRPYVIRRCSFCGAEFNPSSSRQSRCERHPQIPCLMCGQPFLPRRSAQRFCSTSCGNKQPHRLALLRANRGNRPRLGHQDRRGSASQQDWRRQIFERDDYTCQMCGERGGRLEVDHIKPYADYPELRLELSNGRTLCVGCHKKTPTYGWARYWGRRARERTAQMGLMVP